MDVRSCLTLLDRIAKKKELVWEVIYGNDAKLEDIITTLVPDIVDLPQMDTGYDFPGDLIALAYDWLRQVPMPEIMRQHLPEGV